MMTPSSGETIGAVLSLNGSTNMDTGRDGQRFARSLTACKKGQDTAARDGFGYNRKHVANGAHRVSRLAAVAGRFVVKFTPVAK
jgi:hypothetical protein